MASEIAASPADIRNNLDPTHVDALATQLHSLSCVILGAPDTLGSPEHRNFDRTRARFLLLGLREAGWVMSRGAN